MANLRTNNLSGEQGQNAYRGSVFFDGTGDKLSVPNSADVRLGSNDFTVEAWVKFGNVAGSWDAIMGMWDHTQTRRTFNFQRYNDNDQLYLYVSTDGGSTNWAYANGGNLTINHWHHVAGVRDGNTLRVYQNGVQVGTASYSDSILNNTTDALFIGDVQTSDTNNMNGFISNVRLINGTCIYPNGTTFTPPTNELTLVPNTVVLACQNSDDVTQEATGKTITAAGNHATAGYNKTQPKVIPPYGVDAGNTFGGPIQQSSQGYMYFPTGRTEERGRGFAVFGGGANPSVSSLIEYVHIPSGGNTITFGNLSSARNSIMAVSSQTRGIWGGGNPGTVTNTMEFVTLATSSNTTDFGDLTVARMHGGGVQNSTRGVFMTGYTPSNVNTIDFITMASTGDATDFGDVIDDGWPCGGGRSSSTRGVLMGHGDGTNRIQFITIMTTGNSQDFGDLNTNSYGVGAGELSDGLRGIAMGGSNNPSDHTNHIDFITIATTGNATEFGDLTVSRRGGGVGCTLIKGICAGGRNPSNVNTIDSVIIQTTGNATDFGDLSEARAFQPAGCSDSHGGLS